MSYMPAPSLFGGWCTRKTMDEFKKWAKKFKEKTETESGKKRKKEWYGKGASPNINITVNSGPENYTYGSERKEHPQNTNSRQQEKKHPQITYPEKKQLERLPHNQYYTDSVRGTVVGVPPDPTVPMPKNLEECRDRYNRLLENYDRAEKQGNQAWLANLNYQEEMKKILDNLRILEVGRWDEITDPNWQKFRDNIRNRLLTDFKSELINKPVSELSQYDFWQPLLAKISPSNQQLVSQAEAVRKINEVKEEAEKLHSQKINELSQLHQMQLANAQAMGNHNPIQAQQMMKEIADQFAEIYDKRWLEETQKRAAEEEAKYADLLKNLQATNMVQAMVLADSVEESVKPQAKAELEKMDDMRRDMQIILNSLTNEKKELSELKNQMYHQGLQLRETPAMSGDLVKLQERLEQKENQLKLIEGNLQQKAMSLEQQQQLFENLTNKNQRHMFLEAPPVSMETENQLKSEGIYTDPFFETEGFKRLSPEKQQEIRRKLAVKRRQEEMNTNEQHHPTEIYIKVPIFRVDNNDDETKAVLTIYEKTPNYFSKQNPLDYYLGYWARFIMGANLVLNDLNKYVYKFLENDNVTIQEEYDNVINQFWNPIEIEIAANWPKAYDVYKQTIGEKPIQVDAEQQKNVIIYVERLIALLKRFITEVCKITKIPPAHYDFILYGNDKRMLDPNSYFGDYISSGNIKKIFY